MGGRGVKREKEGMGEMVVTTERDDKEDWGVRGARPTIAAGRTPERILPPRPFRTHPLSKYSRICFRLLTVEKFGYIVLSTS